MGKIQTFIMAGGVGERLWPKSDSFIPKQFIKLFDGHSPLQKTLLRNKELSKISVIVREEDTEIAKQQIKEVGIDADIIAEPAQRGTAPCAIIAALHTKYLNADYCILLPVDHYIRKHSNYIETLKQSTRFTTDRNVVTVGIKPYYPNTAYGYLRVADNTSGTMLKIKKFIEKPKISKAKQYVKDGKYFWNSGIFIYRPESIIEIAKRLEPNMYYSAVKSFKNRKRCENITRLHKKSFEEIIGNSMDYAFMEKGIDILMKRGDFLWKDVGAWDSVWETYDKDFNDNIISGKNNVYVRNVSGSLIYSEEIPTAVMGVEDMVIVNTKKSSLIMHKSESQNLKKAKAFLHAKKGPKPPKGANDN